MTKQAPAKRYYVRLTLEQSDSITPSPVRFESERLDMIIGQFTKIESARITFYGLKPIIEAAWGGTPIAAEPSERTTSPRVKPNKKKIGVYDYTSLIELLNNTWTRLYDQLPRDPQDIIQCMEAEIMAWRREKESA